MEKRYLKHSFNVYALNVILGLQKGAAVLKPYTVEFQRLSYECFSIEREFSISKFGKVHPEIILCSEKMQNSILFESSIGDVKYKTQKRSVNGFSQVDRYKSIEKDKMINIAAIPKQAAESHDIAFMLASDVVEGYIEEFKSSNLNFPVLEFDYIKEEKLYCLIKRHNNFSNEATNSFFSNKMQFKSIPKYLQIDIADPNKTRHKFYELSALKLLSILYKTSRGEIFTCLNIAEKVVNSVLWRFMSQEHKKIAERLVNSFIEHLLKKYPEIETKYFAKDKKNNSYKIVLNDKYKEIELSKINRRILQFAKEEANPDSNQQLSLF